MGANKRGLVSDHASTQQNVATRIMRARKASACPTCGKPILVGQQIAKRGKWQHVEHVIAYVPRKDIRGI
ncbi:MAG: hypothetical protein ACREHG_03680 [Candidatus Saccharimonadales bacterium]